MVQHIRLLGYEGRFYKRKITYFDEDELVYWTMGDSVEKTTNIRCSKDGGRSKTTEILALQVVQFLGDDAMPDGWIGRLENSQEIEGIACEMSLVFKEQPSDWIKK